MTIKKPSDQELNAYVDGELDAPAAAAVADAAARDVETAKRLAQLTALKAALPHAVPDTPDIELPLPDAARRHPRHQRFWPAAIAASMVLAVGIAVLFAYSGATPTTIEKSWAAAAIDRHEAWSRLASGDRTAAPVEPVMTAHHALPVPDLRAAKLTLVAVERVALGAFNAMRLGFTGSRGCRVSLFSLDGRGKVGLVGQLSRPELRRAEWQAHSRTFLLLASGMDQARFAHLAKTIEDFTRNPAPMAPATREQLAAARERSAPCVG